MQGQQKYFDKIVSTSKVLTEKENKLARDKALLYRYYYLAEIKRLSFGDAIKKLVEAFFLTESTILAYIEKHYQALDEFARKPPNLSEIQNAQPEFKIELTKEEKIKYQNLIKSKCKK